jgi:hypothetical protein
MTLQEAERFVGKEVNYMNLTGVLQRVSELNNTQMILGYTDNGIVINIVLYRCKDEKGDWVDIEQLPKEA